MKEEYMPTTPEGKLVQLVEEAAEVGEHCMKLMKCVTKLIRFGPDGFHPDVPVHERITNKQALLGEMWDLEIAMARVRDVLKDDDPPCPKCGAPTNSGYGLAGGGIGWYTTCTADGCDYFDKQQDQIGGG